MKRKPNLKGTVKRFLSASDQRWLRHRRKCEKEGIDPNDVPMLTGRKPKAKKPKESDFVRFMNSIETRGPDRPGTDFERWTKSIRSKLESEGIWPTGTDDWNLDIIARYFQELQRQLRSSVMAVKGLPKEYSGKATFWIVRSLEYSNGKKQSERNRECRDEILRLRKTFCFTFNLIRKHLMRRKKIIMLKYRYDWTPEEAYLNWYPEEKHIWRRWLGTDIPWDHWLPEPLRPIQVTPWKIAKIEGVTSK